MHANINQLGTRDRYTACIPILQPGVSGKLLKKVCFALWFVLLEVA